MDSTEAADSAKQLPTIEDHRAIADSLFHAREQLLGLITGERRLPKKSRGALLATTVLAKIDALRDELDGVVCRCYRNTDRHEYIYFGERKESA